MSIQAVAWALEQDLPARHKLVLVSIANHANHTDGYCWLKAETIAGEASCSPRGVFNFVGDLIRNGFIRKAQRRSDDGRQRSNDYWILFHRAAEPWVKRGIDDDQEIEHETGEADESEPQDVVSQDAPGACGKDATEPVDNSHRMHGGAVGPHAPACSHKDSAEPSKTNPLKAAAPSGAPRAYRPPPQPPPQPLGSTTGDGSGSMIFVFKPSRAYDAWAKYHAKKAGLRRWTLETSKVVNGQNRRGWYFPTLFPPGHDPPAGELMTEEDVREFAKTG